MWEQDRNDGPPPYISVSRLRVMYLVDRDDGIRMGALTRIWGASPPSVSRMVDRLQALGFVERRPCPDSRREVMLGVTHAGRKHLARVRERRDQLRLQAKPFRPACAAALAVRIVGKDSAHGQSVWGAGQQDWPSRGHGVWDGGLGVVVIAVAVTIHSLLAMARLPPGVSNAVGDRMPRAPTHKARSRHDAGSPLR
ncbi:MarR family transcriptional regulator [Streptomyces sp. NPDC095817]|uniref:MarR family winged helix-turn-helix transcriptional regulator n=1 Tax=Streptomyces sp. NPDC095817 TaxID=3155082 RepID=UPI00331FAB9E